jgi:predicted DsbA family dithiol-disulfide isomerase
MNLPPPIIVDVFSDVVCPWCYIGKRRLENAIRMAPDIQVAVQWRPFFLNPWVAPEGIERETYLKTKFGSVERYNRMAANVASIAAEEGLSYRFDLVRRQPNTTDCHRLIHWASAIGQAGAMNQRLMELYFTEGGDLTARETLIEAAASIGLNSGRVRAQLASSADADLIAGQAREATDSGIDGVPTFIVGGRKVVFGAQAADVLADAIREVADSAHPPPPVLPTA